MKCDKCKNQIKEQDDYSYMYVLYCQKGHWEGIDDEPISSVDDKIDPWKDCDDYTDSY